MNYELYLSTLADNGSFALEYFLWKKSIEDHLLNNGIEYCELLTDASFKITYETIKNEEKFEKISTIQKYYTQKELSEFSKFASEIRTILKNILDKKFTDIPEEKIRSYQGFLNKTSKKFLLGASNKLRRSHW